MTEPSNQSPIVKSRAAQKASLERREMEYQHKLRAADAWRRLLLNQYNSGTLSDEGKVIIEDLMNSCDLMRCGYQSDERYQAYLEGRRSVVVEIIQVLMDTPEGLRDAYLRLFGLM